MNASALPGANGNPALWQPAVIPARVTFTGKGKKAKKKDEGKPFAEIRRMLLDSVEELKRLEQKTGADLIKIKVKEGRGVFVLVSPGKKDYADIIGEWFTGKLNGKYGPVHVKPYKCCKKSGGCGSCFNNNPKNRLDMNA